MKKPIIFSVNNVYTRAVGGDSHSKAYIEKAVTYQVTFWGRTRAKSHASGGISYVPEKKTRDIKFGDATWFLTGWVWLLKRALEAQGYPVYFADQRQKPEKEFDWSIPGKKKGMEPYPFQEKAISKAETFARGVLEIPTGGGKTLIAMWIVQKLGVKTLYIVPNKLLLDQVHSDFSDEFGKDSVGIVGDGKFEHRDITISTVQTLWSRRDTKEVEFLLQSTDCMIIDECHVVGSVRDYGTQFYKTVRKSKGKQYERLGNIWYEIARKCSAYYRFGLSATPGERKEIDGGVLRGVTGDMLMQVSASDLIRDGYLTRPEIFMYYSATQYTEGSAQNLLDYKEVYENSIINNEDRNRDIAALCAAYARAGKTVLVTVSRIEHGKNIAERIAQQDGIKGDDYAMIFGSTKKADRAEIVERFKNKETKILIGTIFKMGFNVKNLDVILLADAGRKQQNTEQRVGRVLRLFEGKRAIVVDFLDDDESFSLMHSLWRLRYYLSEPAFVVNPIGFRIESAMKRRPFIFDEDGLTKKGESSVCVLDVEAAKALQDDVKKPFIVKARIIEEREVA